MFVLQKLYDTSVFIVTEHCTCNFLSTQRNPYFNFEYTVPINLYERLKKPDQTVHSINLSLIVHL